MVLRMHSMRILLVFVLVSVGVVGASGADTAIGLPDSVVQFFDDHCYDCHNADDREGELDLESLVEQ